MLEDIPGETIHLHSKTQDELIAALNHFEGLPYFDACKHCTMPHDAPRVQGAIQLGQEEKIKL